MNNSTWYTAPAESGDGAQIAHLFATIQSPETLDFTIWSSPKCGVYVDALISGEMPHQDARLTVMRKGSEIGGAISIRRLEGSLFVDNVYVNQELRDLQLANVLIYDALCAFDREFRPQTLRCDVFEDQRVLLAWHRRLSGREEARRSWWRIPLSPGSATAGEISGLDAAATDQARWGFSSFTVTTSTAVYTVGQLPKSYFRVNDARAGSDAELHSALYSLDPTRALFLLGSTNLPLPSESRVATSIRLCGGFDLYLDRVQAQIPKRRLLNDYATHSASV
jgi:hypothetical protein